MKYIVADTFTIETPHGKVTLQAGMLLELSQAQASKLAGKVHSIDENSLQAKKDHDTLMATGGNNLSHYCHKTGCWCSSKLPARFKPTPCRDCAGQKES